MKTQQNLSAKILKSALVIASLALSGTVFTSCSKTETASPSFGGASSTTESSQRHAAPDKPVIYFEQLGGFRETAQYKFGAYASGKVVFEGIRNVGTIGTKQFDVEPKTIAELADFMVQQGFLNMQDKYGYVCDASMHFTQLRGDVNRKSFNKTVTDYSVAVPYELILIKATLIEKLGIAQLLEKQNVSAGSLEHGLE